ncbi:MAG: ISAzo13 family transposase [Candidatus Acidiferrales bacterium]
MVGNHQPGGNKLSSRLCRPRKKDPAIVPALTQLAAPVTGGDPRSGDTYVRRRLRTLRDAWAEWGHPACPTTVSDLLRDRDCKLRVHCKRLTGPPHPDRDVQFHHRSERSEEFRAAGLPLRSIDAKKQEGSGLCDNDGRRWLRELCDVNAPDLRSDAPCRVTPYGLYDVLANRGHVSVSSACHTPEFAAACVARWWSRSGCQRYRDAGALLLWADAGGSNGCRPRRWQKCLQEMVADRYGWDVVVCHYPVGASKGNPVEQRLFGPISSNGCGQPLRTPEVMRGFLRGTQGLDVTAAWWDRPFLKGQKVSAAAMRQLAVEREATCPTWNYTLKPRGMHSWN